MECKTGQQYRVATRNRRNIRIHGKKRPWSSTKGFPSTLAVKTSKHAGAPVSFVITRDDAKSICVIPMK
jgi:hypothetical protein